MFWIYKSLVAPQLFCSIANKNRLNFVCSVMLQEGTIRLKLAKLLAGKYDDVRYEQSVASVESIVEVCRN